MLIWRWGLWCGVVLGGMVPWRAAKLVLISVVRRLAQLSDGGNKNATIREECRFEAVMRFEMAQLRLVA